MEYTTIVLCAGSGTRTGLSYNKMFYKINNQTVYQKTLQIFINDEDCKQIIVVAKEHEIADFKETYNHPKIEYCIGGKERQDSVYQGLQKVKYRYVMIHDGARPYLQDKQLQELKVSLLNYKASLLMVPCKDTIKEVIDGKVVKTLVRENVMQAQTPQAFVTDIIIKVHQQALQEGYIGTDDTSLVERYSNEEIFVVIGEYSNHKITTKEDLV